MFISSIERFIENKLIESELIPTHVDIVRLANTVEDQGIVNQGSYISIAFDGSTANVIQQDPLMMQYSVDFRLEFSSQQYNATDAHDQCFILMAAAIEALLNTYPMGTGYEIERPLMLQTESFQGITDNSQFVYEQKWGLVILIKRDCLPIDPCVRRGFCGLNLDKNVVLKIPRGSIVDNLGRVYTLDPSGELVNPNENGEVYVNDTLYVSAEQNAQPGGYNDNGFVASIHIVNPNGTIVNTYPAYLTAFKLLRLDLYLYRNTVYDIAQYDSDILKRLPAQPVPLSQMYQYARTLYETYFYYDPSNPNAQRVLLQEGQLFLVRPDVTLTIDGLVYVKAYLIDGTEGYVLDGMVVLIEDVVKIETEC